MVGVLTLWFALSNLLGVNEAVQQNPVFQAISKQAERFVVTLVTATVMILVMILGGVLVTYLTQ